MILDVGVEIGSGDQSVAHRARLTTMGLTRPVTAVRKKERAGARSITARMNEQARAVVPALETLVASIGSPYLALPIARVRHAGHAWYCHDGADTVPLDAILRQRRLSPSQATKATLTVARGLQDLHQAGFLHADVKPANVLYRSDDVVLLGDFGNVAPLNRLAPTPHFLRASTRYTHPEQLGAWLSGTPGFASRRDDVYALAAMSVEMMTGKPLVDYRIVTSRTGARVGDDPERWLLQSGGARSRTIDPRRHEKLVREALREVPRRMRPVLREALTAPYEEVPQDALAWASALEASETKTIGTWRAATAAAALGLLALGANVVIDHYEARVDRQARGSLHEVMHGSIDSPYATPILEAHADTGVPTEYLTAVVDAWQSHDPRPDAMLPFTQRSAQLRARFGSYDGMLLLQPESAISVSARVLQELLLEHAETPDPATVFDELYQVGLHPQDARWSREYREARSAAALEVYLSVQGNGEEW